MKRAVAAVALLMSTALLAACSGSSSASPPPSSSGNPTPTAGGSTPTRITNYTAPPATLPVTKIALTTAPPPWAPPVVTDPGQSAAYVSAAGLPYAEEMLQVHYHAHIDINVNGKAVAVPQGLGYVAQGNSIVGLAPLHTHDSTGVIHIENDVPAQFLLGQVFVEWGVRFTSNCLGPYCTGQGKELAVFVGGKRYTGDVTRIVLTKHEEIAIVYGAKGALPAPPASYSFPAGL